MKGKREYLGGMQGEDFGIRRFKYTTVTNIVFYGEVTTPKVNGVWGTGETVYYLELGGKGFDTIEELFLSLEDDKNEV